MILDAEYILKITDSISSMLKQMEEMAFSDDSSSIYPVELYEVSSCFLPFNPLCVHPRTWKCVKSWICKY